MGPALLIAFIGGALTILTPCGPMLLPSFFAWSFSSPTAMARRTGQFTIGLLAGAVPMGVVVGGLGYWLRGSLGTLTTVAAILIICFAVLQFFDVPIRLPQRKAKVGALEAQPMPNLAAQTTGAEDQKESGPSTPPAATQKKASSGALSVIILGFSYSLAAIGCSGPILGAVLSFSTVFASAGIMSGVLAMAFYALGMAFPVVMLAFIWDRFNLGQARWMKPHPLKVLGRWTTRGNMVSGVIMGALGVFLLIFGRAATMPSALTTSQQVDLEKRIIDWAHTIHWGVVMAVIAGVLGTAILVSAGLRMIEDPEDEEQDSERESRLEEELRFEDDNLKDFLFEDDFDYGDDTTNWDSTGNDGKDQASPPSSQ